MFVVFYNQHTSAHDLYNIWTWFPAFHFTPKYIKSRHQFKELCPFRVWINLDVEFARDHLQFNNNKNEEKYTQKKDYLNRSSHKEDKFLCKKLQLRYGTWCSIKGILFKFQYLLSVLYPIICLSINYGVVLLIYCWITKNYCSLFLYLFSVCSLALEF